MGRVSFKSREALEERIEAYFADDTRPPTMRGLALALGFAAPEDMARYRGKAPYREAIRRAITRVGQYAEERLFTRDGGAGARFALAQSFETPEEAAEDAAGVMAEVRARLERRDGA